jgi:hypothetical protein
LRPTTLTWTSTIRSSFPYPTSGLSRSSIQTRASGIGSRLGRRTGQQSPVPRHLDGNPRTAFDLSARGTGSGRAADRGCGRDRDRCLQPQRSRRRVPKPLPASRRTGLPRTLGRNDDSLSARRIRLRAAPTRTRLSLAWMGVRLGDGAESFRRARAPKPRPRLDRGRNRGRPPPKEKGALRWGSHVLPVMPLSRHDLSTR